MRGKSSQERPGDKPGLQRQRVAHGFPEAVPRSLKAETLCEGWQKLKARANVLAYAGGGRDKPARKGPANENRGEERT